jgi:AhpD family alkylhydroperoxidase
VPVARRGAAGRIAEVYRALGREFGVHAEPIVLHSPDPDLLCGAWSVTRETLVAAGRVERPVKEAVATAVSAINECPYCVHAHAAMLAGAGEREAAMRLESGRLGDVDDPRLAEAVRWAAATRSPGAAVLREPPFGCEQAPEMIGTAVLFHYVNRAVSVFAGESPLPGGARALRTPLLGGMVMRAAGRRFRRFARARPAPGGSLGLLPEAAPAPDMAWAGPSGPIAEAWARFAAVVERAGEAALPESARALVSERLDAWDGTDPGLGRAWVDAAVAALPAGDRPAAALALLAVFAPYRVDAVVVEGYRSAAGADDALLVGAVAWPSLAAARRVGGWLWNTWQR